MSRLVALALAFALVVAARLLTVAHPTTPGSDAAMALGFVLILSYFAGTVSKRIGLPAITGYILTGVTFGPHVLSHLSPDLVVLTKQTVRDLQLLDSLALGLIALTAGGELRLAAMGRIWRAIAWIISAQVVLVFCGVTAMILAVWTFTPLLAGLAWPAALATALVLAGTAVANSPATVIAIMEEYRPKGPVTDVVLAITVFKDVVVITLFTLVLAAATVLLQPGRGFDAASLVQLAWEVFGSLVVGLGLGRLVVEYLRRVKHETPLMMLAVAFLAVTIASELHLSGLLACMVAGFYIENFSRQGEALIQALEHHSLPIYVVFFTVAGGSLNVPALQLTWPLALLLAFTRLGLTWLATRSGAWLAGAPRAVVTHSWSGFIAQAGVTLGFAVVVGRRLPGVGDEIVTLILASIAINQIIGPVLFRLGLGWAGEIGAAGPEEAENAAEPGQPLHDADRARP